jgi:hypothetical protein
MPTARFFFDAGSGTTLLNWDYSPDPGPWREPQCLRFNHAVHNACLRAFVLPRAGHDLNLSQNARSFSSVAARWANTWVGVHGRAPRYRCDGRAGPAG